MKNLMNLGIASLVFCSLSCETGNEPIQDLLAPVIDHADGMETIRPAQGEIIEVDADHMNVRFSAEDPSGLEQIRVNIHANFDGHSHARIKNDFERLEVNDIYSPEASKPELKFPAGAMRINIDGMGTDIYWEGEASRVEGPVLAGPYDFSIEATDIFGNQTGFAEGSSYIATFQIRRPYAPVVEITNLHEGEIEGEAGEQLQLEGMIAKSDHELSSDLAFIWVRLTEEHEGEHTENEGHNHRKLIEEAFFDKMWGVSSWINEGNGASLPDAMVFNLAEIFFGDNAIILPSGEDHLELVIWAEDINGNITEMHFQVHVE